MALHGITVTLYTRTQAGVDGFNAPIYTETAVQVDDVIIGNPAQSEQTEALNLTGRRATFVLGIPKGDTHDWLDKKVAFFGRTFRQVGAIIEGQEDLIPLRWHKKVTVEEIDG